MASGRNVPKQDAHKVITRCIRILTREKVPKNKRVKMCREIGFGTSKYSRYQSRWVKSHTAKRKSHPKLSQRR